MHKKPIEGKWVVIKHDSTDVAYDLGDTAGHHQGGEGPRSPFHALNYLDNHGYGEEGDEDGAAGEGGAVFVDTGFDGAGIRAGESAVGVRTVGYEAIGKIVSRRHGK